MKRDMELVRKMLLAMEDQASYRTAYPLEIEGYAQDVIFHHAWLMQNAGLIACNAIGNPKPKDIAPQAAPVSIDWNGYEFLNASRDPTIWEKAKETLKDTGRDVGTVTLSVLTALLIDIARRSLGLPPE